MTSPRRTVGCLVVVAALAVGCCLAAAVAGAAAATDATVGADAAAGPAPPNATLVEAYPNTVEPGNDGEFVAVHFEEPANTTGWTLTDGNTVASLPNRTLEGVVAFSTSPRHAQDHTDHPVVELDGRLLLAIDGDELELRAGDVVVDLVRYYNAPESEVRDFEAGTWRPLGATDRDPGGGGSARATAFVLPDAPGLTAETLARADDRLYLAGYTLSSEPVGDALLEAHERGVEVRVLLDGAPVGGIDRRQAGLLDDLVAAGVDVRVLAGPHTRYRHHHPKYAVVDDRALVTTENFKPAGTGGKASRGWGVVLEDRAVADELAALYAADWEWRAATPWADYRTGRDFSDPDPAFGGYDTRHPPERVDVAGSTVLVSPDNAAEELSSTIEDADERILVQQVEIDGPDNRLLEAAMRAADRGVTVRIHLADAWYVADDNGALVEWLNDRAAEEGWDLEARLDDPDGYGKIHTKGVVVDDTVVVGSLNWGSAAKRDNREVVVALEGSEVAEYYADVFDADWTVEGDDDELPAVVLGSAAVGVAGALLAARRIEFRGRDEVLTDWQT